MDDAKQQLADKLKTANNILVTVSRNPSVDQLTACLGLTLLLDKQGKHAVSVFSGQIPAALEFLEPDKTIEKNTDSLRDFIIALDKNKADKLRYKVEDDVVRIFITPYKTSISQEDFAFSQGDFNVEVIVALGVREQQDLDQAITDHGRILHDATLTSISTSNEGGMGTINWYDPQASSLSELVTELAQSMGPDMLDTQIATALLTGIVSETERFSNDKTSPQTMSMSSVLMAAGANQQLVASKLEEQVQANDDALNVREHHDSATDSDTLPANDDGIIAIDHSEEPSSHDDSQPPAGLDLPAIDDMPISDSSTPNLDDLLTQAQSPDTTDTAEPPPEAESANIINSLSPGSKLITEPPTMGGMLTANSIQEQLDPPNDPLGLPSEEPPQLLDHGSQSPPPPVFSAPAGPVFTPPPANDGAVATDSTPAAPDQPPETGNSTLAELENSVKESEAAATDLNSARDQVNRALNDSSSASAPAPEPIQALGAQPLGTDLHPAEAEAAPEPADPAAEPDAESDIAFTPTLSEILSHTEPDSPTGSPPASTDPAGSTDDNSTATPPPDTPLVIDSNAPPPVPPPIPFQFGNPPPTQ